MLHAGQHDVNAKVLDLSMKVCTAAVYKPQTTIESF